MYIEFHFTKMDLIDFNYASLSDKVKDKKWERLGCLILGLTLFLIGFKGKHYFWSILGFILLGASLWSYKDLKKSITMSIDKLESNGKLTPQIGQKRIELDDLQIKLIDINGEVLYNWEDVTTIKNIGRFLVIQINEINLPIPVNIENLESFKSAIKAKTKSKYAA